MLKQELQKSWPTRRSSTTVVMKGADYVVTNATVDGDANAVMLIAAAADVDTAAADDGTDGDDRTTVGDTFTATDTAILAGGGESCKSRRIITLYSE